MGTWDTGTFDNDDAADWASELANSSDLSVVVSALAPREVEGSYLEAPEGVHILCAAEVVAALKRSPAADLPDEVKRWVEEHGSLDVNPLLEKTIAMIDRVLGEHSEIHELWSENEELFPVWRDRVLDLRARLARAVGGS